MRNHVTSCLMALIVLACATPAEGASSRRMIVLGVDGLDPVMLREFMAAGVTPNLMKLAAMGGFMPLGTSIPPQSPVAWSDFITGMDPGGHGLFDFIALDRKTLQPYLSSARVEKRGLQSLPLGRWRIPFGRERTVLLRDGQAFWEILDEAGVPATIFQVPANYPPVPAGARAISGMGTPDLRGTPGTFSFYTDDPTLPAGPVSGGIIRRVKVANHLVNGVLEGPPNSFLADTPWSSVNFSVRTDAIHPVALVRLGAEEALLNVGEWSDWLPVSFPLVPGMIEVPGMVRIYLQGTSPRFGLYISPVNIDPRDPAQPISYPAEYAFELAEAAGPFYTEEMPEDTKALSAHVLSTHEFLRQTDLVMDERRLLFSHELERFRNHLGDRFLFFYLSTVDQRNHMLARQMDSGHPFHEPDTPRELAEAMRDTYREVDEFVGRVLEILDPQTAFLVMSDHGFAPFRRGANLNTWLEQQGYLRLKDPANRERYEWLGGIDWSGTRAFAIGLNSLFINVRGRERSGIVPPEERETLAREIAARLALWKDSHNGEQVVTQPLVREDAYHGSHVESAPDIVVGYARGYRASWATSTGKIPPTLIEDNDEEWSGDHCMDARVVPGVLLANQVLKHGEANLRDLPVTILSYFGVAIPPQMRGRPVF